MINIMLNGNITVDARAATNIKIKYANEIILSCCNKINKINSSIYVIHTKHMDLQQCAYFYNIKENLHIRRTR